MAYKSVKFADLAEGDMFRLSVDGQDATKITPRRAFNLAGKTAFPLGASVKCLVFEPDPTPEELATRRRAWLHRRLNEMVTGAVNEINSFRAKLDENPLYAFEWADRAIDAAGAMDAGKRLLLVLTSEKHKTDEEAVAVTMKLAAQEATRGARWPSRSTSPVSNVAKAAVTSAYAELVMDYEDRQ